MSESKQHNSFKPFKFRELNVYSSTEWLAGNKKRYRQVFERYGTSYVYAELSFYNKLFDQEVWEVDISLKCFEHKKTRRKVCSLDFKRKVSKFDNIVYIREGWGNKKDGAFWKKGTYYWEAWVNDERVATKYFYIEDAGNPLDPSIENYLSLNTLKLYEGQYDDVNKDDRRYLKAFSTSETGYIYTELSFVNNLPDQNWHCEFFVKFYNESRELKGQSTKLTLVKEGERELIITAGWGSNNKGSWREGDYSVDIFFGQQLIATAHFKVGEYAIEGQCDYQSPFLKRREGIVPIFDPTETFSDVLARLNELIGLDEIKKKVADHAKYIQFLQLRKDKGFDESTSINIHSVFTGNPGTGKTTVAKMMGSLYQRMGLLSKGHVHEVDRVDLVGEYIGQTAPKVKDAIEKARGGVLFIDEAYALARSNDDSKDFGREVIEIIVKEMSNGRGDIAIIVAGYPTEMKHFIDSNPGLKSRFKHYYEFRDYLPQELSKIAKYACAEKQVVLSEQANDVVDDLIVEAFRNRDKSFGNARFVHDLIDKAKINLGLRIMDMEDTSTVEYEELETVLVEDVHQIKTTKEKTHPNIPIDHALLESAMEELNGLIGIKNIKKQISETVELIKYHKSIGENVLNKFFYHTVFIGNPGTGKTTVARILCKIYKALGILERGHMVETDRQGLVAGFVGQTASKTTERIDEALGGVLFIDEAYALSNFNGLQGDYGNEAIQTLLKRMEDDRGEFFVFAAGYPSNMERFLKANPGLSSRFDTIIKFSDYDAATLLEIAFTMFDQQGYELNQNAIDKLEHLLTQMYSSRDKYFGNAREIRKLVSECIKNQILRTSKMKTKAAKFSKKISIDDINQLNIQNPDDIFEKKKIGFSGD